LNLLVASSSLVAQPVISQLDERNSHELLGVITNPDKPMGRGQLIEPNSLASWVDDRGIKLYKPIDEVALTELLDDLKPDLIITIAFGRLVSEKLLHKPRFGWINVHFSILPKWRGAAPVQWSILTGENKCGLSIFKLDKGMDTGPIYLTHEINLDKDAKTEEVLSILSDLAATKLPECLNLIETGHAPYNQSDVGASKAPKFDKSDGQVDWGKKAENIYNLYRAISHNPGIWTNLSGKRLKLETLRVCNEDQFLQPGAVLIKDERFFVGAGEGAIEILELTPAGRHKMSAGEFIRGLSKRTDLYLG
jgi:methionyl-tRNA formyltransferase